ncbi:hypothetical protein DVA80_20710, partial [Acinetobacter baumannii]
MFGVFFGSGVGGVAVLVCAVVFFCGGFVVVCGVVGWFGVCVVVGFGLVGVVWVCVCVGFVGLFWWFSWWFFVGLVGVVSVWVGGVWCVGLGGLFLFFVLVLGCCLLLGHLL